MKRKGFTLIELIICVVILFVVIAVFIGSCAGCGSQLFFKSEHTGKVTNINNLTGQLTPVISGRNANMPANAFSFAVELSVGNEFLTFSAEDRQFATVEKGDSISVIVFKYPPWNFSKGGTHYGGRLLKKYKNN